VSGQACATRGLVMGRGIRLVLISLSIGLGAALGLTQLMAGLLDE
jgi:hypothetical protein